MVAVRKTFGACNFETLLVRVPCEIEGVEAGNVVLRDDSFGPLERLVSNDGVVTLGKREFSVVLDES